MLTIPANKDPHCLTRIIYNSNFVINISLQQFDLVTIHTTAIDCAQVNHGTWDEITSSTVALSA